MGNMKDLLGMIPGMGKAMKGVDIDDNSFKPIEAIIRSMTNDESEIRIRLTQAVKTELPKAVVPVFTQVNQLLKQFEDMRKLMKTMNKMGGGKRALNALNPFGR